MHCRATCIFPRPDSLCPFQEETDTGDDPERVLRRKEVNWERHGGWIGTVEKGLGQSQHRNPRFVSKSVIGQWFPRVSLTSIQDPGLPTHNWRICGKRKRGGPVGSQECDISDRPVKNPQQPVGGSHEGSKHGSSTSHGERKKRMFSACGMVPRASATIKARARSERHSTAQEGLTMYAFVLCPSRFHRSG